MSDILPEMMEEFDQPEENMDRSLMGPPHNRMAEEAVIGSMLLDPSLFNELIAFLKPEDFYIRRNGMIWEAFEYLLEQKIDPDIVTISDYLERNKVFSEIGGLAYLTELVNNTTTTMNAAHYAVIVHNNAIRRRMINTANLLAKLAFDEEKEIVQILDEAEKSVFNLSENRTKRDLAPLGRILGDVYKQINELSTRDADVTGVPTGLNMLDKFLGGLQKSDLLIVAGRPGMGKTGFLLTAAKNAALIHKKNVAYFSLEMANEQLAQRYVGTGNRYRYEEYPQWPPG
jgi:replicative DNA helicase